MTKIEVGGDKNRRREKGGGRSTDLGVEEVAVSLVGNSR